MLCGLFAHHPIGAIAMSTWIVYHNPRDKLMASMQFHTDACRTEANHAQRNNLPIARVRAPCRVRRRLLIFESHYAARTDIFVLHGSKACWMRYKQLYIKYIAVSCMSTNGGSRLLLPAWGARTKRPSLVVLASNCFGWNCSRDRCPNSWRKLNCIIHGAGTFPKFTRQHVLAFETYLR